MYLIPARYPYKWTAVFNDGTKTNFGHQDYQDYTQHHDPDRRRLYRERHEKDLRTRDPKRAGFLSYYILWGPTTSIAKNLEAYNNRFNL
jgi:hypothetical protein